MGETFELNELVICKNNANDLFGYVANIKTVEPVGKHFNYAIHFKDWETLADVLIKAEDVDKMLLKHTPELEAHHRFGKGDIIGVLTSHLRKAAGRMDDILAPLNLPAALDDVSSLPETLPESMKLKSAKVEQSGGITELHRLFNELPGLYSSNEEIIVEAARLLKEALKKDELSGYGAWTLYGETLTQELEKYRRFLASASNADKMVKTKFDQNSEGIERLSSVNRMVWSFETRNALKRLCKTALEVIEERDGLEKELREKNCEIDRDFLKALGDSQLLNEQISKEKIDQIYGPHVARVNETLAKQESLLADIQSSFAMLRVKERHLLSHIEKLSSAHNAYFELKGDLDEGTKFYNDLTPILVRLQQKISDFAFARQMEKESEKTEKWKIVGKVMSSEEGKKMSATEIVQLYVKNDIDIEAVLAGLKAKNKALLWSSEAGDAPTQIAGPPFRTQFNIDDEDEDVDESMIKDPQDEGKEKEEDEGEKKEEETEKKEEETEKKEEKIEEKEEVKREAAAKREGDPIEGGVKVKKSRMEEEEAETEEQHVGLEEGEEEKKKKKVEGGGLDMSGEYGTEVTDADETYATPPAAGDSDAQKKLKEKFTDKY